MTDCGASSVRAVAGRALMSLRKGRVTVSVTGGAGTAHKVGERVTWPALRPMIRSGSLKNGNVRLTVGSGGGTTAMLGSLLATLYLAPTAPTPPPALPCAGRYWA